MRPLELTLRGFQSYASGQTFDFRDRHLLGIVGPIGSGKSSLLDGIAFALYGRTPRAGRGTRDLINQRGNSAHVELWFEVEGETWRAVRALRRRGQSAHNLFRHLHADADSERLEEVTGERAMTARVEELLGLDFDAFNRSVFLAQNRFAEFLQATAAQRDAVLKGVFGFDRLDQMADHAKAVRDGLRADLADLERLRVQVTADRRSLDEATAELGAVASRRGALDAAAGRAAELEAGRDAAARDLERAGRRRAELDDIAAQLPARDESAGLLERATTGAELLVAAEAAQSDARAAVEVAQRHQAEVVAATGGPDALARADGLLRRLEDLDGRLAGLKRHMDEAGARAVEAESRLADARARASQTERQAGEAEAALALARRAAEQADEALHQARHASMAVTLRRELAAGGTCPVCEQSVATLPSSARAPAVDRAEKQAAAAHGARDEAQRAHTAAVSAAAAVGAEIEGLEAAAATAAKRASEATEEREGTLVARSALVEELGRLVQSDDPVSQLEERRSALAQAAAVVEAARDRETAAGAAVEEVRARQAMITTELVQLATTVATLAGQLGDDLRPRAEAPDLAEALDRLRGRWEEAHAGTERGQAEAQARVDAAAADLGALANSLGLETADAIAVARQHAAAEHGKLAERVEALSSRVARFDALEAGSAEAVARLQIYTTLADDLLPSRFLKFVLDEERRSLAALGSEHFERMTRGRYRFTEDGEFDVADLSAAEAERKAESLSGGETFLASLSLALALAEMVTRTGGRLDAFFLDEGFGSLDPDHLDLAMEGIEALVGGDRLVAVVSHVPQLRERVEDLIELDTHPVTGDTVVVRP